MLADIYDDTNALMQKSITSCKHELAKIRTGRAHPSILDGVRVSCYDQLTPINQVASIIVEDARTLLLTPWDKSLVSAIDKAIRNANLDLNPVNTGDVLRIPLPSLTEETRRTLVRRLGEAVESGKISVRNVRRDANDKVKKLLKIKEISEDEERKLQDKIQKLTDNFIAIINELFSEKETELMKI